MAEQAAASDRKQAEELLLEEFKAVRREVEGNILDIRLAIRYALVGTAAVWAWVATHEGVPSFAMYLPLGIMIPGLIHTRQLMEETAVKGEYIHSIEQSLGLHQGWEHFLKRRSKGPRISPYSLTWMVMIVVVIVIAAAFQHLRGPASTPNGKEVINVHLQ